MSHHQRQRLKVQRRGRRQGQDRPGQYADFAVLSADYLSVPDEQITSIESVLTVTGGDVVYSAAPFEQLGQEGLSLLKTLRTLKLSGMLATIDARLAQARA
jgi:hypothetical protein